ncbi:MAG: ATP-binding cassette domain-containing protein [Algicola sp.]|nr:ATP-binding cassette domain-containing protein [Algicola sp.]
MKMNAFLWHEHDLQQGLSMLGVHMGSTNTLQKPSVRWDLAKNPNEWLHEQGEKIDLNAQRVELPFGELQEKVVNLGPCLIKLTDDDDLSAYLVVASTNRRGIKVFTSDGTIVKLTINELIDGFIHWLQLKTKGNVDRVIERFKQSAGELSEDLQRKLFVSLMSAYPINQIWTFSAIEKDSVVAELKVQGAYRYLYGFLVGLLSSQLFFVTSWFVLGSNVLAGRAGTDWLPIWSILLFGYLVSRLYTRKKQQALSLLISLLIKKRMLKGMTHMPLELVKKDGPCNLLTRCYESGQFESASVGLVLNCISSFVALFISMIAMIGLQMWGLLSVFLLVGVVTVFVMVRLYQIEAQWTSGRLALTHSLAELMIGQRTRRVQEAKHLRHKTEDGKLNHYIGLQQQRDTLQVIYSLIPSSWNVLGLGVLLLGFATDSSAVGLPVGAGLWLLVTVTVTQLSSIYLQVIRVAVAWTTIAPLLSKEPQSKQQNKSLTFPANIESDRLLEVRDVAYSYPGRDINVLDGVNLQLSSTDKIILEGQSGSGKSTLISLLTGIRPASRGSILLNGVEQNMVSKEQWGERVVMVPQYHENYLFTETMAFNLLLGTEWPAEPEQLEEARMICHELGLTSLLKKMPSEMMQVVGEMGWTLSHGEKSRIYVARAVLQKPDLIILDESLASLDPENSHKVLACIEKHCKAVIIVAHP